MNSLTIQAEWVIAESDEEWEQLCAASCLDAQPKVVQALPPHRPTCPILVSVVIFTILLLGVRGWWGRTTLAVQPQSVTDERATAAQEVATVTRSETRLSGASQVEQESLDGWQRRGRSQSGLNAAIQSANPTAHPNIAIDVSQLQEDGSLARVVVTARNGEVTKRQTRFYRRTATSWELTTPDPEFWGPPRSLETPSFIFHFRESDAAAAIAVAPEVEALYQTMRRNFGLASTPAAPKLGIEVSVAQLPWHTWPWFAASDRIRVASPTLYPARVELSDTELLLQSLASPLLQRVLAQARQRQAIPATWQPLVSALRLWQLWDLDLPLSVWRAEIVQWVYQELPRSRSDQTVGLPARYQELCASHLHWMRSPMQIYLPLFCTELDRMRWQHVADPPTRLAQLTVPLRLDVAQPSDFSLSSQPGQMIALVTLIDHAVATYGRDRLPALVSSLDQYDHWETLLPAVYGVSPAEFEAGWQAHLTAQLERSRETPLTRPMMQGRPW